MTPLDVLALSFIVLAVVATTMAVRAIFADTGTGRLRAATATEVDMMVDFADQKNKYKDGNGTVQVCVTEALAATLSNKTLASPTITGGTTSYAAAGSAGAVSSLQSSHVLANNSAVDFFTVTVPNGIVGGAIDIFVSSMLGDGDSTDSAIYTIAVSRITGANAKAVASSKSVVGATAGATGNAVITLAVSAISGAVGATNTFTITVKNARSAGSSDNHPTIALARCLNLVNTGITIAAA